MHPTGLDRSAMAFIADHQHACVGADVITPITFAVVTFIMCRPVICAPPWPAGLQPIGGSDADPPVNLAGAKQIIGDNARLGLARAKGCFDHKRWRSLPLSDASSFRSSSWVLSLKRLAGCDLAQSPAS